MATPICSSRCGRCRASTVVQTGARGGTTSLFVRGGASNFNKVLIDGVPANDIGGAFDFSDLATTGVERVEVLRGSNSVMYGSDALTRRRQHHDHAADASRIPEATLSLDGGNLGTSHEEASLGGGDHALRLLRRVLAPADRQQRAEQRVSEQHVRHPRSASSSARPPAVSGTVRYIDSSYGSPNAFDYFGIADDSSQTRNATYASIAAHSQLSPRWTSTHPVQRRRSDYHYVNPSPTGLRSDPSAFANYLGNVTTITGGNGYCVTGRAILDYGGDLSLDIRFHRHAAVAATAKPSSA